MEQIGFDTVTVAGEGPVDRTVSGLEIAATGPPDRDQLHRALADADLVVVENLCSIPLNLPAARATAALLRGRPAILHHHDPPWQRARFRHITELPPTDDAWRHVTINRLTREEMAHRGIEATCIHNGFPTDTGHGDRLGVRARLGVSPDALLLAHPARAIPRKDIPTAVHLAEELGGTYWLWGPPEDGYDDELAKILRAARCPVVQGTAGEPTIDLYSAAPVEAAIHRLPAAVGPYPVKTELLELGLRWYPSDDAAPLRAALANPDPDELERNRQVALRHLSLDAMSDSIRALLRDARWIP